MELCRLVTFYNMDGSQARDVTIPVWEAGHCIRCRDRLGSRLLYMIENIHTPCIYKSTHIKIRTHGGSHDKLSMIRGTSNSRLYLVVSGTSAY